MILALPLFCYPLASATAVADSCRSTTRAKLFFTCGAGDDSSYVRFWRNKGQIFQPIAQAWHRNLRSDSVHTGSIGTGVMLVLGFGTQPYA